MKSSQLIPMLLLATFLITPSHSIGMPSAGGMTGGMAGAAGGDKKKEEGNTVNVISQNAVESNGNQTQSFLDRLERRDTIVTIRKTINKLNERLADIQTKVHNRLNQIQASGKCGFSGSNW